MEVELTGDLVGVNDRENSGALFVTCRLEFSHRQGVHVDPSGFSDEVDDCYSRHQRVCSLRR